MNAIREESPSRSVSYSYGPAVDEILSKSEGSDRFYYHRGNVNSVLGLTDMASDVANSYLYSAFGEPEGAEEGTFNPYRYTARRVEGEGDYYYFRERLYSPSIGRFTSLEPLRVDAARTIRMGKLPVIEGSVNYSPLFGARLEVNVDGMDLAGYVYAGNNPANAMDPTGEIIIWNPASASGTSGCAGSGCLLSGCGTSGCLLSVCAGSGCGGSGCVGSGCGGSGCGLSGCGGSACKVSACLGSGCARQAPIA
jgi:RHS repeat-associated protein